MSSVLRENCWVGDEAYRHHAEELRTIAECVEDQPTRDKLLKLAPLFDRMAASAECIARSKVTQSSSGPQKAKAKS